MSLWAQNGNTIIDSYNAETAGNYYRALEIMDSVSKSDPQDEFYLLRSAWLKYQIGLYPDAIQLYTASNKKLPSLDAQVGILNCQLALGKWNEALAMATGILKTYPQNTTVMSKAAYAHYMKQEYRNAADYYERIIKISPWDMEVRGYLVNNLYLSKDVTEAKKHYLVLKKYYPLSSIVRDYAKAFE